MIKRLQEKLTGQKVASLQTCRSENEPEEGTDNNRKIANRYRDCPSMLSSNAADKEFTNVKKFFLEVSKVQSWRYVQWKLCSKLEEITLYQCWANAEELCHF